MVTLLVVVGPAKMAQTLYNWSQALRQLRFGWLLLLTIIGKHSLPHLNRTCGRTLTLLPPSPSFDVLPTPHRMEHQHFSVWIRLRPPRMVPRRRGSFARRSTVLCRYEDRVPQENSFVVTKESEMGRPRERHCQSARK